MTDTSTQPAQGGAPMNGVKPVGIAYLILVHRFPDQFKRMFAAIHDPANHYVIHVDANSPDSVAEDIAAYLGDFPNAAMLDRKPALWGGYSLVDAELRGMAMLLKMGADWTHFINLSGQDFPLRTQGEIAAFLAAHPDREYIRMLDQAEVRPDTMHRVTDYCIEAFGRIIRTSIKRRFPKGAKPYIGTQWMIVSRAFCEFACEDARADRFKSFYRRSFIADEGFFQTLMMGGAPHGTIVPDDLRMIDWIPDGDIKLRPRTYTSADADELLASDNLFARKFDMTEDAGIFTIIETRLNAALASARALAAKVPPLLPKPVAARVLRPLIGIDLPERLVAA
jgi:Core-2/I-Branching enzyme